jgi:hypothetical protein
MWKKRESSSSSEAPGGEFENVAASLTAEQGSDQEATENAAAVAEAIANGDERFVIREEWAESTVKLCFLPLAKFDHPAWMPSDDVARAVAPKMQVFLQAVADKYAPQFLGKFATRHAELFDLVAAMGIVLWQQFSIVRQAKLIEMQEALERQKQEREKREAEALQESERMPEAA